MLKITSEDRHFLRAVLAPSWLSWLVIILAALIVTGGAVLTFSLNHSGLKQDLIGWEQNHNTNTLSASGQSTQSVAPTLANSWPLIIVWAGVGLLTYSVAVSIVRFILESIQFRRQLEYVNADPRSMLEVTVEHLVTRIVASVLLLLLVLSFIYHMLPYTISVARISANGLLTVTGSRDVATSFLLTAVFAYFANVLLRLSLGKARIFTSW
jgi:hypothetical protein